MSDAKGLVGRRVHADALADSIESGGVEASDKKKKRGPRRAEGIKPAPAPEGEEIVSSYYLRPPCRWFRRGAAWLRGSFLVIVVTFVFPWIPRSMPGLPGNGRALRIKGLRLDQEERTVPRSRRLSPADDRGGTWGGHLKPDQGLSCLPVWSESGM